MLSLKRLIGWSVFFLATITFEVGAKAKFEITPLGNLGCPGFTADAARAINRIGQIVGEAANANCRVAAFLYDPDTSTMEDLGVLPGAHWSRANGINDSGMVVGTSGDRGFVWDASNGMRELESPPDTLGGQTEALAINGAGLIVGNTTFSGAFGSRPCVWRVSANAPLQPEVIDVLPDDADYAVATAINDDGAIVGRVGNDGISSSRTRYSVEHAARWHKVGRRWKLTDLGAIDGKPSAASAINGGGAIVGAAGPPWALYGWLIDGDAITRLGSATSSDLQPFALSDLGIVVGVAVNLSPSPAPPQTAVASNSESADSSAAAPRAMVGAAMWSRASGVVPLPALAGDGAFDRAYGVNRAGTIVGSAIDEDGHAVAVRWGVAKNTPAGGDIEITPTLSEGDGDDKAEKDGESGVRLTFPTVTTAGESSVELSVSDFAPPFGHSAGAPASVYEITTTAEYEGPITVCIDYQGIDFPGAPALFRREHDTWIDCTQSIDSVERIVCGEVSALSDFALYAPPLPFATLANQLEIKPKTGSFHLISDFSFSDGGDPSALAAAVVQVRIGGDYSFALPAGALHKRGQSRRSIWKGLVDGVTLGATLEPLGDDHYRLELRGRGIRLGELTDSPLVDVIVGAVGGSAPAVIRD